LTPRISAVLHQAYPALVVALAAGVVAAPGLVAPIETNSVYDGGITSSAAAFILHGQVPYRDFWLLYGPLASYLAAAVTAILGPHVLVMRIAGLLLLVCTAALGYRLIRVRAPGIRGAFIAVAAATIPAVWLGLDFAPWQLSTALALLALDVGLRGNPRSLLIAGGIVGIAALARLDLGAYALIAIVVQSRSLRPAVGAAAVFAPVALVFVALVPVQMLWQQLIWYPLAGTQIFRAIPGPTPLGILSGENPIAWAVYYVPVLMILGAMARRLLTGTIALPFVGLTALALLCRLQTVGRADGTHAAQAFGVGLLLAAYVIGEPSTFPRRLAAAVPAAFLCAIAILPLAWLATPPSDYDRALTEAVSIVRSRTAPDEPIFVGEVTNARVFINPMIVYFLADRPAGVFDTMYNPGITTTAATQQRMVDDLASRHVRYLVLDRVFAGCYEKWNASAQPGSTVLDEAISRDYGVVADLGAFVIMASRSSHAPPVAATVWVDPSLGPVGGPVTCDR
jgi:hypothetical protein